MCITALQRRFWPDGQDTEGAAGSWIHYHIPLPGAHARWGAEVCLLMLIIKLSKRNLSVRVDFRPTSVSRSTKTSRRMLRSRRTARQVLRVGVLRKCRPRHGCYRHLVETEDVLYPSRTAFSFLPGNMFIVSQIRSLLFSLRESL